MNAASTQNASLTEQVLTAEEQRAEDNASRLLELTQRASEWERMVESFKKAHESSKVTTTASYNFLQWGAGAFRLSVVGAENFRWEEVVDGKPEQKSCPCLHVKVIEGDTRAAKALVGQTFRVSIHWQMARSILDHIGYADERKVMGTIKEIIEETPDLITSRVTSMLAYIRCDKDGIPLKQDTKKGRRVLADAQTMCAG